MFNEVNSRRRGKDGGVQAGKRTAAYRHTHTTYIHVRPRKCWDPDLLKSELSCIIYLWWAQRIGPNANPFNRSSRGIMRLSEIDPSLTQHCAYTYETIWRTTTEKGRPVRHVFPLRPSFHSRFLFSRNEPRPLCISSPVCACDWDFPHPLRDSIVY